MRRTMLSLDLIDCSEAEMRMYEIGKGWQGDRLTRAKRSLLDELIDELGYSEARVIDISIKPEAGAVVVTHLRHGETDIEVNTHLIGD